MGRSCEALGGTERALSCSRHVDDGKEEKSGGNVDPSERILGVDV